MATSTQCLLLLLLLLPTPHASVVDDAVTAPSDAGRLASASVSLPEAQALGAPPVAYEEREDDVDGQDDDEEYEDSDEREYYDDDEDAFEDEEEFEYEDGGMDDEDRFREDEDEYDDDYIEDEENDEREGAGDGEVKTDEVSSEDLAETEEVVDNAEQLKDSVVRERRAEVRSLSDLPLSKLLRVQTELRRLTDRPPASSLEHCSNKAQAQGGVSGAGRRWLNSPAAAEHGAAPADGPDAQPLNWGGARRKATSTTTPTPIRRGGDRGGGWSSHEEWEEEEEEEGGWMSWKGGKKKGKGDIGSLFQLSVTFLAFLAFGGYLLCLILQAIKGGGYWNYPYNQNNGQLRPANFMMVMVPNRAVTRRPTRPGGGSGRRKRRATREHGEGSNGKQEEPSTSWKDWMPSFGEQDFRLLPEVDADRMHRALLVLAEGYASFYHRRFSGGRP